MNLPTDTDTGDGLSRQTDKDAERVRNTKHETQLFCNRAFVD